MRVEDLMPGDAPARGISACLDPHLLQRVHASKTVLTAPHPSCRYQETFLQRYNSVVNWE